MSPYQELYAIKYVDPFVVLSTVNLFENVTILRHSISCFMITVVYNIELEIYVSSFRHPNYV